MKKRIIYILLGIITITILALGIINQKNYKIDDEKIIKKEKTTAVVYFSVTNNTKKIAEYIKELTDSDIERIFPKEEYTKEDIDYTNTESRTSKEAQNDEARPEINGELDLSQYDTIYLGYPIWWNNVPKIILTLIDNNKLEGKTIIPFCTSSSSEIENSEKTLNEYNKKINWQKGKRFSSDSNKDDVKTWLNSLNLKDN